MSDTATATATARPKREKVWTKEKFREYARDRWRRVNNVAPERRRVDDNGNKITAVSKYSSLEEYMAVLRDRQRARKKPVPKTECALCGGEHYDTPASKARHENNRRHRLAVEVAERLNRTA